MLQRTLPAGFIAPCLPTKTDKLPSGSQWLHEIKHDGFRIIARKTGAQVRLYSRPGNDLTRRFPLIVNTLARLHSRSCIIDGEAVACDDNGVASFDLIRHQRANDSIFQAQGFRLPFRSLSRLAQNEERKCTGREARSRGGLVKGAPQMSLAPPGGQNRIMIYGPKDDGTYIVEFRTAAGEALAISIPRTEQLCCWLRRIAAAMQHYRGAWH